MEVSGVDRSAGMERAPSPALSSAFSAVLSASEDLSSFLASLERGGVSLAAAAAFLFCNWLVSSTALLEQYDMEMALLRCRLDKEAPAVDGSRALLKAPSTALLGEEGAWKGGPRPPTEVATGMNEGIGGPMAHTLSLRERLLLWAGIPSSAASRLSL